MMECWQTRAKVMRRTEITKEEAEIQYPGALAEFPFVLHEAWKIYLSYVDLRSSRHDGLMTIDHANDDIFAWHDDGKGWRRL